MQGVQEGRRDCGGHELHAGEKYKRAGGKFVQGLDRAVQAGTTSTGGREGSTGGEYMRGHEVHARGKYMRA